MTKLFIHGSRMDEITLFVQSALQYTKNFQQLFTTASSAEIRIVFEVRTGESVREKQ